MSTSAPDIAVRGLERLTDRDLRFLVERFPAPAASYEEMARVLAELPSTLESLLDAEHVFRSIYENRRELLEISPFLLFNVLLRRCTGRARTPTERAVVNYLANLLSLFVRAERVWRPLPSEARAYEYLVDLAAEAARANEHRSFLLHAHIGNYALYLTGIFGDALRYRRRHKRRPLDPAYYADMGRIGYRDAASNRLARLYRLEDVFLRLALQFDYYRDRLNVLAREYIF
jgi:hypothetical protein